MSKTVTARTPIIFVDDDSSLRRVTEYNLQHAGYDVTVAINGLEAWNAFQKTGADLVITDLAMPEIDGHELLQRIKRVSPDSEVIIITAHGTIDRAVEAMKAGAFEFITKPFEFDVLRLSVERALEHRQLKQENQRLQSELIERFRPEKIIGVSAGMKQVFDLIGRVAAADSSVLILGESGTGKEMIASAIHHHGKRKNGPFIAVNCGALPRDLIESELFGVLRGAFTGADRDRPGRFERASGGTLFLDEITELPTDLQVKLLRALQEREIERLGADAPVPIDVRFICATNADIGRMVDEGGFRADLYFRVNVVAIQIPPLRSRPADIEPLVTEFLRRSDAAEVSVTSSAFAALKKYHWPGNVRELENTVERAVVLRQKKDRITVRDLPDEVRSGRAGAHRGSRLALPKTFPEDGLDFAALEESLLKEALRAAKGNCSRAARLLGMTRQTFLYRLKKFGIQAD